VEKEREKERTCHDCLGSSKGREFEEGKKKKKKKFFSENKREQVSNISHGFVPFSEM